MKHLILTTAVLGAALLSFAGWAAASPMEFNEVSLLVRAREPESSILKDASQRKLLRPLTSEQENLLKKQGASNSLVQSLRNSNLVVSKEEAAAFESRREQATKAVAPPKETPWQQPSENVRIFDVALGHPINLSQWGGYDYELAFYAYRTAGEDIIEPVNIDPIRTVTMVYRNITNKSEDEAFAHDSYRRQRFMPYDNDGHRFTAFDARRDLKDDRFNLNDTVSVSSWAASRPLAIDWSSPIYIKGVPYALYPVYAAGGVSLYYIGGSSTSVKLAVVTARM